MVCLPVDYFFPFAFPFGLLGEVFIYLSISRIPFLDFTVQARLNGGLYQAMFLFLCLFFGWGRSNRSLCL